MSLFIERVGYANDEPISISSHYYSYNKFPPLIRMYHTHQSITKTLQSLGTGDYTRTKTLITSRLPNSQECELLNVPKHVPLLITQGVDVDAMQQPIGFIEARFASDRVDLQV